MLVTPLLLFRYYVVRPGDWLLMTLNYSFSLIISIIGEIVRNLSCSSFWRYYCGRWPLTVDGSWWVKFDDWWYIGCWYVPCCPDLLPVTITMRPLLWLTPHLKWQPAHSQFFFCSDPGPGSNAVFCLEQPSPLYCYCCVLDLPDCPLTFDGSDLPGPLDWPGWKLYCNLRQCDYCLLLLKFIAVTTVFIVRKQWFGGGVIPRLLCCVGGSVRDIVTLPWGDSVRRCSVVPLTDVSDFPVVPRFVIILFILGRWFVRSDSCWGYRLLPGISEVDHLLLPGIVI